MTVDDVSKKSGKSMKMDMGDKAACELAMYQINITNDWVY